MEDLVMSLWLKKKADNTKVAIKIMKKKLTEDTYNIANEILTMRTCQHKNIVNFMECYECNGEIWMVMEYCDGGTLRDLCQEVYLAEPEIGYFLKQITQGLAYLHQQKRIHRDIKSENILLNLNGDVKLADLGLVQEIQTETSVKSSPMVGTPFWMAPEVICKQPYGSKIDLWALGCVAFELAVGTPPYHSEGPLKAMLYTAISSVHSQLANLPCHNEKGVWSEEFKDFLFLCFQTRPQSRPTAAQLLQHPFLHILNFSHKDLLKKLELVFIGTSLRMNGLI